MMVYELRLSFFYVINLVPKALKFKKTGPQGSLNCKNSRNSFRKIRVCDFENVKPINS